MKTNELYAMLCCYTYNGWLQIHMPVLLPITIIYVILFITGVLGNFAVCIVIVKNKSMHTATNYYLFSLAVSDLVILLLGKLSSRVISGLTANDQKIQPDNNLWSRGSWVGTGFFRFPEETLYGALCKRWQRAGIKEIQSS